MIAAPNACTHHWLVEPPNGRYSQGVCRHCQAVRDFDNSWGGQYGDDDPKATFRDTLPAVLGRTGLHLVEE